MTLMNLLFDLGALGVLALGVWLTEKIQRRWSK
jgi:hypothetical protein